MHPVAEPGPAVLIVEDDLDVREVLAQILDGAGYGVCAARNGEEALAHLRRGPLPAVILLNLMMPIMNGWAFRDELDRDPVLAAIPVVLLSGVPDLEKQAERLRAVAALPKPVLVVALLGLLRKLLR